MGSVMAVALGLLEGSPRVRTSRPAFAHFVAVLPATAVDNLRRDAGRTLRCARDLDRFSAGEPTLYLPVTQSGPAAGHAP